MNDGLIHHSLRFLLSYKLCGVFWNIEEKQGAAMTLHLHGKPPGEPRYEMSWTAFPVGHTRKVSKTPILISKFFGGF